MFDDPKKELQQLEEQLLALEQDEDFERFYEEIYDEFGTDQIDEDNKMKDLMEDFPARNHTGTYVDNSRFVEPVKKDNSIRNLTIIACVETLGIVGVVIWWLLRLL